VVCERRTVGCVRHERSHRPVREPQGDNRCGSEWTRIAAARDTKRQRGDESPIGGKGLVDRPYRLIAWSVVIGSRPHECEDSRAVGHGHGPESQLFEDLVGDRSRRGLGETEPEAGERRLEQLENGRLPPQPAHPRHDRIVHITDEILAPLRERYGEPRTLHWDGEVSDPELALITHNPRRRHDVTLFIFNGERLALVRKPHFEPGVWRTPGGGIKPGEEFAAGAVREALEETGADIQLDRFLLVAEPLFRFRNDAIPWQTLVLSARTRTEDLEPVDTDEIEAARWGTAAELRGPIRTRLLATGRALWRYRVALHDAALEELTRAPAPPAPR
jgi:8-oxo-dGTP pyrophosphatase MutT (NUDIX family)